MTQLNLVESARQGDPQAIAILMNLALEPRGVTARTKLNDGCLYICLRSSYVLNQAPLVKFIRRGLAGLGVQSIQTVTVYGQKIGQSTPVWRETLQLGETRPRIRQKSQPTATKVLAMVSDCPAPQTMPPDLEDSPRSAHTVAPAPVEAPLPIPARPPAPAKPGRRSAKVPRHPHKPQKLRVAKRSRSPRYRITSLTALIAFLSGGTAAIVTFANAQTASRPTTAPSSSTLTAPDGSRLPSEADLVNIKRQQEAKQYLRTMNQAQQAFYQHHQRFAADLEELERSANLIARSYHYTYQLTATDQLQAQLTAVPKDAGLKSYTAVVSLVQSPQQTITTAALICESAQPSQTSPTLILTSGQPIACPTGAAAVQ
ncbi:type IV pilin-like G/H family protein [Pantanalinema rosaneae CENA516]|uniref:type IV pilin-like G/H family protein n=1 Tax=Pantanalinema rosaneae TaxID=1620701 RepID=UPI003D6E66A8